MCKTFRNIELLFILLRKLDAVPFTVGFTVLAHVDRHVENTAFNDAHKLTLRKFFLKMQAAQHALRAHRLVVLNEIHVKPGFSHIALVVSFHEVAAAVAVNCGLYDVKTLYGRFFNLNLPHILSPLSSVPARPSSREAWKSRSR